MLYLSPKFFDSIIRIQVSPSISKVPRAIVRYRAKVTIAGFRFWSDF
jgi:hypothetical protein